MAESQAAETKAEAESALSGSGGGSVTSARAGLIPVALEHVPLESLEGIGIYIRLTSRTASLGQAAPASIQDSFRLFCGSDMRFKDFHKRRLTDHGVKFVYLPVGDHNKFRRQTEACLNAMASDPATAASAAATMVYETSVELMNELLTQPEMMVSSPRLEQVSRSVATLVISKPAAFSHLFAASHHDFYTATHMVNVATWMVPLAYELGHKDPDELNLICQAGVLHDIGKIKIPETLLNKKGKLSDEDWKVMRGHPEAGRDYLASFPNIDPLVIRVVMEHHERLDGTGYPLKLSGEAIHPLSRICAVVDSFDAMTAFRPFKDRTFSVAEAIAILKKEAPSKYDQKVVDTWVAMVTRAEKDVPSIAESFGSTEQGARRLQPRKTFHCKAKLEVVCNPGEYDGPPRTMPVMTHNVSCSGLGFLSREPIEPGKTVRINLQAKGWEGKVLEGQVMRCRLYNDHWHEIGMEFTGIAPNVTPEAR